MGHMPDIIQFGADEMGESERKEFMAWYHTEKIES